MSADKDKLEADVDSRFVQDEDPEEDAMDAAAAADANAEIDLDEHISPSDRESVLIHERQAPPETEVDKVFRWSTAAIGVLLLTTIAIVVGMQFWSVAEDVHRTTDELLVSFETAGLDVGSYEPLTDTSGAEGAVRARINGEDVKIYRFAEETSEEQRALLETIRKNGAITVDGKPVPAKVNGPFVMTGYQGNPREQELLTSFKGFGTSTD